jgi:hypothetical protein
VVRILYHTAFCVILFIGQCLNAQSFSIYSVYKYGDKLSKEQDVKINDAEWNIQEAKLLNEEIRNLERELKIVLHNSGLTEEKKIKKTGKIKDKKDKLMVKRLDHLLASNALFYEVYKEKIDDLWEKCESGDEALVIVKALENNGIEIFDKAKLHKDQLTRESPVKEIVEIKAKANDWETIGLDMISSALEGYYNYELALKQNRLEGDTSNAEMSQTLDAEIEALFYQANDPAMKNSTDTLYEYASGVEYQNNTNEGNTSSSMSYYDTNPSEETIVISRDALIVYMNDEALFEMIMDNFDIDGLEEDIFISRSKLEKVDEARKIYAVESKGAESTPAQNQMASGDSTVVNISGNTSTSSKIKSIEDINMLLGNHEEVMKQKTGEAEVKTAIITEQSNIEPSVNPSGIHDTILTLPIVPEKGQPLAHENREGDKNNGTTQTQASENPSLMVPPVPVALAPAAVSVAAQPGLAKNQSNRSHHANDNAVVSSKSNTPTEEQREEMKTSLDTNTSLSSNDHMQLSTNEVNKSPAITFDDAGQQPIPKLLPTTTEKTATSGYDVEKEPNQQIGQSGSQDLNIQENGLKIPSNVNFNSNAQQNGTGAVQTVYKIQIAASRQPLSNETLRSKYQGNQEIGHFEEEGWHKYVIGAYSSLEEANHNLQKMDLADVFVTAYEDDRRISIKEAKAKQALRPSMVFRVQVAASRIPIDEQELRRIYRGKETVIQTFEDGWYKYTIQGGSTLRETKHLSRQSGVRKAFPVVYVNNKRVDMHTVLNQF